MPRILVVTIVHHPGDARIAHREIPALLEAGWDVTFAAPYSGYGVEPPAGVTPVDVRRVKGRRRLGAIRAVRRQVKELAPQHDIVLLHDPELLISTAGLTGTPIVWDVHEDIAGAVMSRAWIPVPLRRVASWVAARMQRWAEKRHHLILAEDGYTGLFREPHPVVPNSTRVPAEVPPNDQPRVVWLGSVTETRGVDALVAAARLLRDDPVEIDVYGPAHDRTEQKLRAAHDEGALRWHGFVPNDEALLAIEGATAGLALVRDEPNYRHSRLTKLMEYLARGVPFVTTPLPTAAALAHDSDGGVVVGFDDPEGVAATVRMLLADDGLRHQLARAGHAYVSEHHNWNRDQHEFVALMAGWARRAA